MSLLAFPTGHYFSVVRSISSGADDQSRTALLRHRLIWNYANKLIPLVTFDPVPNYDPVREALMAEDLLLPNSQIVNMHEWLREHQHGIDPHRAEAEPEPAFTVEETYDGGREGVPWRVFVKGVHSGQDHWDYLRPDGTRYLRTPADSMLGTTLVLDHQERVVADHDGLGDLWRWWTLQLLPPAGPVFLISDCRFVTFELGFLNEPRVHLLHQMHNPHQSGTRQWNSPVSQDYHQAMESISSLDMLSVFTKRQAVDVELAYGSRDNLAVIPHPIEAVKEPDPLPPREHGRIVMVAPLEPQKRIDLAISAFEIVAAKNALARLDIYGDGPDRDALEAQILDSGLGQRVTLHGHDPRASDQFWTADLGWLTSAFEGFPHVLLEGRVRKCPFVSFDIPYGPDEHIVDGVDSVLVPAGDVARLADATLSLLADSELLESMREPARQTALVNGYENFVALWAAACQSAHTQKPQRTSIARASFESSVLQFKGARPQVKGVVRLNGTGDRMELRVRWQTWLPESPAPVELPLDVQLEGDLIHVSGKANSSELPFSPGDPRATSRLLIEWANSTYSLPLVAKKRASPTKRIARRVRKLVR